MSLKKPAVEDDEREQIVFRLQRRSRVSGECVALTRRIRGESFVRLPSRATAVVVGCRTHQPEPSPRPLPLSKISAAFRTLCGESEEAR